MCTLGQSLICVTDLLTHEAGGDIGPKVRRCLKKRLEMPRDARQRIKNFKFPQRSHVVTLQRKSYDLEARLVMASAVSKNLSFLKLMVK